MENGLKNLEEVVVRKWRWWVRDTDLKKRRRFEVVANNSNDIYNP